MRFQKRTRRGQKIKNKLKKFRVMYHNIRGGKSKYDSFLDKVGEIKPALVCLTESHLMNNENFPIDGYKDPFRNDRDNDGGGVLIAVKNELANSCTLVDKSKRSW